MVLSLSRAGEFWHYVVILSIGILIFIWKIILSIDNYYVLLNIQYMLARISWMLEIIFVALAFFICLTFVYKMKGSEFSSGLGLFALAFFFLYLSIIFDMSRYESFGINLRPENIDIISESWKYWIFSYARLYFIILRGIFILLAALAIGKIVDSVKALQIEIDEHKAQQAIDSIVDTDYFRDIQKEASRIRKDR